ncbi:60S acidic ribosomal protein P0-like [Asparagus officinalis]|uniref:60S acidic ribosomal protein P0-like n=1 Tax=Asparagus officinalis TaxID=4686 RepID=UPI00098E2812|nr:60S acidic ribosomal protein P0-like [Asparagus officinalis]
MVIKVTKAKKKLTYDNKLCSLLDGYHIKSHSKSIGNKNYLNFLQSLVRNIGLIFTKGDLKEVSEKVAKYKVGVPASIGLVALTDVVVSHILNVRLISAFQSNKAHFQTSETGPR